MDPRFLPHNAHRDAPDRFEVLDPQLRRLSQQPLVHRSPLLDELPRQTPGIYTIGGGRQVGKSTLLKQWMAALLDDGVHPDRIAYFTGELIDDHHGLLRLLQEELPTPPGPDLRYVIVDEVSYIRDWDKAVKFLADAGMLDRAVLVLTGSDLLLVQEARMRLPGRRGRAAQVDFQLRPLTFGATVDLKGIADAAGLASAEHVPAEVVDRLHHELESYLVHGGFLTAINDIAAEGRILPATYRVYADWLRGDMLKRGKQEHYLREVLTAIVRRQGSQVTWNALARELSIDHPGTVQSYVQLLARMDAVFVQPALREDKLAAAPKKARKVLFADPFMFHAVRQWLDPVADPYDEQALPAVADPATASRLVEAVVATHHRRFHPTFYIKARRGEVDVATVVDDDFHTVEVKWGKRVRSGNLSEVRRTGGRVVARVSRAGTLDDIPIEPLALHLLRVGQE